MASKKTVKSALAIIPSPEIWDGFQKIRSVHDKAYKRWPPHINLLYPFLPEEDIAGYIPAIMEELASISPFKATFGPDDFGNFCHSKSATIWISPPQKKKLADIEEALVRAVPQCNDLLEFSEDGFVPHLSLAQTNKTSVEKAQSKFMSAWKECSCVIDSLYVLTRDGDEPFSVAWVLPLGKKGDRKPIRNTDKGMSVYTFLTSKAFTEKEEVISPSRSAGKKSGKKSKSKSKSDSEKESDGESDSSDNEKVVVRKKVDIVSEELKSKKKPKLRTSNDVFDRILWDKDLNPGDYTVTYKDRFDGMMEVPFLEFPTEDVPFHRIWSFKKNGQVVWDRAGRIDRVFKAK